MATAPCLSGLVLVRLTRAGLGTLQTRQSKAVNGDGNVRFVLSATVSHPGMFSLAECLRLTTNTAQWLRPVAADAFLHVLQLPHN